MPTITAQYAGECTTCGITFDAGEVITYERMSPNTAAVTIGPCCNGAAEPLESNGADFDAFTRGRTPGIAVLPRGKTGKDACARCFQVPASSGACGCDA